MLRSRLTCTLHPAHVCPAATRAYATKQASGSGSRKKAAQAVNRGARPGEGQSDSKMEAIRQTLLESDPSEADRLAALRTAIPSAEAHETIQRAWQLRQRHAREAHAAELARKYGAMRSALDTLERTDARLFKLATEGRKFQNVDQSRATNARLEGIVPREMRVPTELPGGQLWDHEWKAPQVEQPEPRAKA
ncbi:mitochondrial 54S ribosomal protein mL40 MRPL28 [Rhodotorula paludigena]|uniref:mitochondrial 54S ribosomal protein mL40 MRPL28 n=1 Tax=Rhodotorula paludigena TaxID=86838 RepID=UPI0031808503